MLWLIGPTADDETKEPAREHWDAGTTKGAEKQTGEDDEASTTEDTAVEERPTVEGRETGGNSEESNGSRIWFT
jgi:hypothetical protein